MNFLKKIPKPGSDMVWTIVGGILTIGSFLVDNIMEDRRIIEAVKEEIASQKSEDGAQ